MARCRSSAPNGTTDSFLRNRTLFGDGGSIWLRVDKGQHGWFLSGNFRPRAGEPVKFVYNTLDSWAMCEYDRDELDMATLDGLYCPGPQFNRQKPVGTPEQIKLLERVKCILLTHYPLGSGLRELLRDLDRAIASIGKWDGKPRGKVYREPE